MAFANSADTGSSVNGGLYANVSRGQLMEDLDVWCFDKARQTGDTVIIRTSLGYHILYLCEPTKIWMETAERDLIAQMDYAGIEKAMVWYRPQFDADPISGNEEMMEQIEDGTLDYDELYNNIYNNLEDNRMDDRHENPYSDLYDYLPKDTRDKITDILEDTQ